MAEAYGITPADFVTLYNFGHFGSNGTFAPNGVNRILQKAFVHLGWSDVASAYASLAGSNSADLKKALNLLGKSDLADAVAKGVTDEPLAGARLRAAVCVAILERVSSLDRTSLKTNYAIRFGTGESIGKLLAQHEDLLARTKNGQLPVEEALDTLYRYLAISMTDQYGRPLELVSLMGITFGEEASRLLANTIGEVMVDLVSGGLDLNSELARVMFEADTAMKLIVLSPELFANIPGFKSPWQHEGENMGSRNIGTKAVTRAWLSPVKVEMGVSPSENVISFGTSVVRMDTALEKEPERADAKAPLIKTFEGIRDHFNRNFDQYAEISPIFHSLREAAKIVALANWLRARNIKLRLQDVQQQRWNPPRSLIGYHYLGNAIVDSPSGPIDYYWSAGVSGGVTFEKRASRWTEYTPSKVSETRLSNEVELSRQIGQQAAIAAGEGDLEKARDLAQLSADALTGGVSRGDMAKHGIRVSRKAATPVSPAALDVQKELLKETMIQINALEKNPTDRQAGANISTLSKAYATINARPKLSGEYLAKLKKGEFFPRAAQGAGDQQIQAPKKTGTYDCSVCYDGLLRNIGSKLNNRHLLSRFVDGALGYYQNCKQKANGACGAGDQFSEQLRVCDGRRETENDYAVCIRQLMCFAGYSAIDCSE